MTRRYGLLFLAALVAAALASMAVPRLRTLTPPSAPAAGDTLVLRLEILAHDVTASASSLPVGTTVVLRVQNASPGTARLVLAGYEDRVDSGRLAPRSAFEVTFLADRPGERFAWIVDGVPRGRLDVTGSHLQEGHR